MIAAWKRDTVLLVCTCIPDEFCIAMTLFFVINGLIYTVVHHTKVQASSGLSISFEVASSFWKVGVSLLSERRRREPPRGVWGHAPPENFEI